MTQNAKILVKAILVCLLLSFASAATAEDFRFDNCRLLNLESSFRRGLGNDVAIEDKYRYYPRNLLFKFDQSGINWGKQRLRWSKKTAKGIYVAYFYPPGGRLGVFGDDQSRLNLTIMGNNQGTVRVQKSSRHLDGLVNFICGSVGQPDPEPERSAIAEEAANCYLNPSSIRQAQKHLKYLGLYNFTIDGVSGRGTKAAIKKAKKLVGRKASAGDCITAKDITEFRFLAEKKLANDVCQTSPEGCEETLLCKFATVPDGSNFNWKQEATYQKYVTEAKRRALSCGVKQSENQLQVFEGPTQLDLEKDVANLKERLNTALAKMRAAEVEKQKTSIALEQAVQARREAEQDAADFNVAYQSLIEQTQDTIRNIRSEQDSAQPQLLEAAQKIADLQEKLAKAKTEATTAIANLQEALHASQSEVGNLVASLKIQTERSEAERAAASDTIGRLRTDLKALSSSNISDMRAVHTALKKLGYYSGEVDRAHGDITKKAIKKFQNEYLYTDTGVLTNDQLGFLINKAKISAVKNESSDHLTTTSQLSQMPQKIQATSVSKSFYYPGKKVCRLEGRRQALIEIETRLKSKGIKNIRTWRDPSGCFQVGFGPFNTKNKVKLFVENFDSGLIDIAYVKATDNPSGTYPFDLELILKLGDREALASYDTHIADMSQIADRKEVQTLLKTLEYYADVVDGDHGDITKKAIKEFQKGYIYAETGELTNKQLYELRNKVFVSPYYNQSSEHTPITDLETQNLKLQQEISNLVDDIGFLRKKKESKELGKELARLALLNRSIDDIFDFFGILSGQPVQKIAVTINENCFKLKTDMSFEQYLSELITQSDCLTLNDPAYELVPGKRPIIEKNLNNRRIFLEIQNRFSKQITSINASIFDPDFDVPMCAFGLVLENRTGEKFSVPMLPDTVPRRSSSKVAQMYWGGYDLDIELAVTTTFTATAEDIKKAVAAARLTDDKNDWANLKVQIKQLDDPNVSCRPISSKWYSIGKDGKDDDFLILQDGELRIPEISLVPATDDLLVFISTHIGREAEVGGLKESNKNYPFSNNPSLQDYYLVRSLEAIKKYIEKPDPKYRNIKIFLASDNDYEEVETAALPNVKNDFEVLRSEIQFKEPLLQPMPSVAQKLLDLGVPSSTGVLIIGSFGFGSENLCNSLELTKIWKNTSPKNRKIINFVPINQLAKKQLEYPQITDIPLAFTCPDKPDVTLVGPSGIYMPFPEEVLEGLLTIINKSFER